ncbi:MAG: alpha/beta fold hydrolase [Pseudomonadales bacterium]|nr:alpha/beta fold hydrolase [Pseudomonadales bacterium]
MHEFPVGFRNYHPNPTINYQFNRWLPEAIESDLVNAARVIEAPQDCPPVFLDLAANAALQGCDRLAATYCRAAEFFMTAGEPEKLTVYRRYRTLFYRATAGEAYERLEVPFQNTTLPIIRVLPRKASVGTLIIHGGFDSYMEEFLAWAFEFSELGWTVILFEGPGQGAALREQGLVMTPEWEAPVAAVLDGLGIDRCVLFGLSLGGYLALRAAAFEPRISAVILVNILADFLDCFLDKAPSSLAQSVRALLAAGDRDALNALLQPMWADPSLAWALDHGQAVSGARDSFEFFAWLDRLNTRDFSDRVTQPCLVTAGNKDHIVPLDQFYEQSHLLRNSAALTTRLFTDADNAAAHCQVGNLRLLLDTVRAWISNL